MSSSKCAWCVPKLNSALCPKIVVSIIEVIATIDILVYDKFVTIVVPDDDHVPGSQEPFEVVEQVGKLPHPFSVCRQIREVSI